MLGGVLMKRLLWFITAIWLCQPLWAQGGSITGVVRDGESGEALPGANVVVAGLKKGGSSDQKGEFAITNLAPGKYTLAVSFLGYKEFKTVVEVQAGATAALTVRLQPTALLGKEVTVVATRAVEGETPAAFSTLSGEQLRVRYYAQDIPAMLSELPSTTFYSESGSAVGYTYLSIRGFDQRRISVMINGIPQNDPEDHSVYWVDFPDFLANTEDIQVQRGAGSAFYGPPAIGGSVNIITSRFSPERSASIYTGYGSYNTYRLSAALNSGLLKDRYVVSGRISQVKSDGYRERSWVDFKSYFLGLAWFGEKSSARLHFYGGPIEDHLAYYGISKAAAQNRETRRQNPIAGDDEIENFNQPHLELIHTWQLGDRLLLNNALFGIRGYGFFDYDGSWAPLSYYRLTPQYGFEVQGDPETIYPERVLIRAYVDNKQAGWLPTLTYRHSRGEVVLGSELRLHRSLHWGRIQKGSEDLPPAVSGEYQGLNYIGTRRYYEYKGGKDVISPYLNANYRLNPKLALHGALQLVLQRYRLYDEKFLGNDFEVNYTFLNPRLGVNFTLAPQTSLFASYSRTSREPRLKNLYDAAEASTPLSWGAVVPQFSLHPDGSYNFADPLVKPEKLHDVELGFGYGNPALKGNINFFYMDFKDEIVKQGQLDRFGQPVTGNAERTVHAGVELSGQAVLLNRWQIFGNLTFSQNELKRYTVYEDDAPLRLDGNPIAGFPDFLANARAQYQHAGFTASLSMQHVGKRYTDNFKNENNTVDPYTVFHGTVAYDFGKWLPFPGLILQLHVQNIFDTLYITHGEGEEFFPAAERHFFVNARLGL